MPDHKWVSVTERLPELADDGYRHISDDMLVFDRSGNTYVAYLQDYIPDEYEEDEKPFWVLVGRDGYRGDGILFWKELPAPPKGLERSTR